MPRPGPRMPHLSIRMPAEEIQAVEEVAEREGESKSEAARLLLSYAVPRMPEGWRSEPDEQAADSDLPDTPGGEPK